MTLYVWWITQRDYEQIGGSLPGTPPDYLRSEYRSRIGRPGRGRLWVNIDRFGPYPGIQIAPWPEHKRMAGPATQAGGIVFDGRNMRYVLGKPGFVTNLELDLVTGVRKWGRDPEVILEQPGDSTA